MKGGKMAELHIGPKRRAWERLKYRHEKLSEEIAIFNEDLEKQKQLDHDLGIAPIDLQKVLPKLPPMPDYLE
jgi:hypothetical protein